jgi:hypothetical protein
LAPLVAERSARSHERCGNQVLGHRRPKDCQLVVDAAQARALEKWLSTIKESYWERILPIDQMVADEWGMSTPSCRRLERIHHIGA